MATRVLSNDHVESAYERWAPFYDAAFEWVMGYGRKAVAAEVNKFDGRVLDVGIGTGLELPMFKRDIDLVGVDLSESMLEIARKRVAEFGLTHVEALLVMDALNLQFPDDSFDTVVAPYVLTVVPNPHLLLDELSRVVKPGGAIILVNHIGAASGPVAWIEALFGMISHWLGWNPQFPWSIVGDWLAKRPDIELLERRPVAPIKLFTLIRMRRRNPGEAAGSPLSAANP